MLPALLFGTGGAESAPHNGAWVEGIAAGFRAGDPYPRWLATSFESLGSPAFYFYPPMAHWVAGLFRLWLPVDGALASTGALFLIASGLAMYAFLARLGARPLLGASLYMAGPYHLMDFYVRGALAEFAAYAWLPLVALSIMALPARWAVALLAISFAGLIVCHLPMAMLACVFLIGPIAIWKALKDHSVIAPGLTAAGLGLAIAAFYLLPALTLQEHISQQLFWGAHYRPSNWSVWEWNVYFLTTLGATGLAMVFLASGARSIWTVIALLGAVAALNLVPPLWDIPPLDKAQFPWRLLCVVEFAGITALALSPPRRPVIALAGALLFSAYTATAVRAWYVMAPLADRRAAEHYDAPEYLPRGFNVDEVTDLQRRIDLDAYRGVPDGDAIVVAEPATVTVRRSAFPIWRVVKDGVETPSRGPLITFDATPGVYRIERVRLWQELVGGLVSLLGIAVLAGWALWGHLRPRHTATD